MADDSQDEVDALVDEMATEFFEDPRILLPREDGKGEVLLMRILAKQFVELRKYREQHVKNWELVAELINLMAEWTDIQQERDQLQDLAYRIHENTEAMKDNE